jgi:pimeloyl-ACP methyl ester carboxylesterase
VYTLERAKFNGIQLEYAVEGSGEPVVLIHGAIIADGLSLLRTDSTLPKDYRIISYSRQGYAGSIHPGGPLTIPQQADDCRNLMRYLSIEKAHIVGSSYGGAIAWQLALDSPEYVHSVSLLEPVLPAVAMSTLPGAEQFKQEIMKIFQIYQRGDKAGAIDAFLRLVLSRPDYRTQLDAALPGAFDQAVRDADTFFTIELPAMQSWSPTIESTKQIKQSVQYVGGAESFFAPAAKELGNIMAQWFQSSETIWIPKATHGFLTTNKKGLVEALYSFFARHPLQIIA